MNGLSTLLERASARRHALSRDELVALLGLADPGEIAALHAAAYAVKVRHSGRLVSLRGIIEMGNVCAKDCYYCGIRKGNDCVGRFELDEEAVLRAVRRNIDLRYGSLVLQSGEIASEKHTAFIERILRKIDELGGGAIGVTLSLGEQSEETYARWRAAGAHRYLLRIETSSPELYAKLHPADHSFERRVDCLRLLRKCGYQVGSGVMSGLPGQTLDDLAGDILFFRDLDLDMIGMGPYIPHPQAVLPQPIPDVATRVALTLRMIAATRLALPTVNIAATTALQTLAADGLVQGLRHGANVVMPQATPLRVRQQYTLYDGKACLDDSAAQVCIQIHAAGRRILRDAWGDRAKA